MSNHYVKLGVDIVNKHKGWIAVDLDGTLAIYNGWIGYNHIGEPIPAMVERVKNWLLEGYAVKIFTARAYKAPEGAIEAIEHWCRQHIGRVLPVTCIKDWDMIELWDDRCIQVLPNTGIPIS